MKQTGSILLASWWLLSLVGACCDGTCPADAGPADVAHWDFAFDNRVMDAGSLSSVWGSSPNDVYIVGGAELGTIVHFDGTAWERLAIPEVPLLVWVHGTGPDDIWAVGVGGGALHFDGTTWARVETGVTGDLWGVFARAPDDIWVVGGDVNGSTPILLHGDGEAFTAVDLETSENPVGAAALFKVWGIGDKLFAVGQRGLIVEYVGGRWVRRPAGSEANDDFVSLWGTSEDNIVAVGGRANARVARYDGQSWRTLAPYGVGGINGVFVEETSDVRIVGVFGLAGTYNLADDSIIEEMTETRFDVHAVWGDGAGHTYAVGGNFLAPFAGVALTRVAP